jgi:hypothetical protein
MPQDASTNADVNTRRKSKRHQSSFRSSPKVAAIIQRLRYVGEHVFGGDIAAYGEAVGFSKAWMYRILNSTARLRLSTFTKFVESGVVSAEWLFCGVGPMSNKLDVENIKTFTENVKGKSAYPLLDTTTIAPHLFDVTLTRVDTRKPPELAPPPDYIKSANTIFQASTAGVPVIMYLDADAVFSGCGPIINEFLRKKWINAVIMPCCATLQDLGCSSAAMIDLLKRASVMGIGIGEAFGLWGIPTRRYDKEEERVCRAKSVIATAYDLNVPCFVHLSMGNSLMQFAPATADTNFGAIIGATAYVDMLGIAELIRQTEAGPVAGVFLVSADAAALTMPLLHVAQTINSHTPIKPQSTCRVIQFSPPPIPVKISETVRYRCLFSTLYSACESVSKGTK